MKKKENYSAAAGQMRLMAESVGLPGDHWTRTVNLHAAGDYGADPVGNGLFRMVPSGDIVDFATRNARLNRRRKADK